MNNGHSQNVTIENETKGRGLFYGVVAVAAFVIMVVGTTFAYFTAETSSGDRSVNTGSTTLQLDFISYQSAWMNNDLIPAYSKVVEYAFKQQNDTTAEYVGDGETEIIKNGLCKDDVGNSVCSVYVFQVGNTALSPQFVSLDVISTINEFTSLHAAAYQISAPIESDSENYENYNSVGEGAKTLNNGKNDPVFAQAESDSDKIKVVGKIFGMDVNETMNYLPPSAYTPVYVNRLGVVKKLLTVREDINETPTNLEDDVSDWAFDRHLDPNKTTNGVRIADDIEIPGGSRVTIALVLYILDNNQDQTSTDAGRANGFSGAVKIGPRGEGSGGVTGSIEAALTFGDLDTDKELAGAGSDDDLEQD